jgi:SAM-dependent methyltransferase
MRKVLNVGGNSKAIPLPPQYAGWEHVLLDIDPRGNPDVVCDARQLTSLPSAAYDSVYCSHNLEHYHRHDAAKVLAGFAHVLKPDGFVLIRVPDVGQVMRAVVEKNLDIDDVLYQSPAGPIAVQDVLYGYGVEIERSGNDFYAHKTGFTQQSLKKFLNAAGFVWVYSGLGSWEVTALAFVNEPTDFALGLFGLPKPD